MARDGLHPALVALLFDASREIFGGQTLFAEAGESRQRRGLTSASRLTPIGIIDSGRAGCINTCRSGWRRWPNGLSSYCSRLLLLSSRFSTTCPSCFAGTFGRASIVGTASWLCSSGMLLRARERCPRRNGWQTWTVLNEPSPDYGYLMHLPVKLTRCVGTSNGFAAPWSGGSVRCPQQQDEL